MLLTECDIGIVHSKRTFEADGSRQAVSCRSDFVFFFFIPQDLLVRKLEVHQEEKKVFSNNICSKVWIFTALHRPATPWSMAVNHQEIPVFPNMFMHHTANDSRSIEAAAKLKTKRCPLLPRAPPCFLIQRPVWCHAAPRLSQHRYYLTDMQAPPWAGLDRMVNGGTQLGQKQNPTFTFSFGREKNPKRNPSCFREWCGAFEVGLTEMSWFWRITKQFVFFSFWNKIEFLYTYLSNPSGLSCRSICLSFKKII